MIMAGERLKHRTIVILALAATLCCGFPSSNHASDRVTVFAAASLSNAITDIGVMFSNTGKGTVVSSFASSSTLAKQIENGAPANLFISADEDWMNYLDERRMIVRDSRLNLLSNKLVVVSPLDSNLKVELVPNFPLGQLLGRERLAVGDPDHVPAGKYAKAALEKLGVWSQVESKLARAENVRAALALVERGECPLGIVYSSDARISQKLKVVGTFLEESHPPITYPAALVAEKDTDVARAFLDFLKGPEARLVFEKYGFGVK